MNALDKIASELDRDSRAHTWGPGGYRDLDDPTMRVVVEVEHYLICEEKGPDRFRGFGGRLFTIEFFDGRRVSTTNLMHQGTVPARWRERFPDNARFLTDAEAAQAEQKGGQP